MNDAQYRFDNETEEDYEYYDDDDFNINSDEQYESQFDNFED